MNISVVVPMYFSQSTIEELVNQITEVLVEYKYEIILVNDGSTDRTGTIAKELALTKPNIIYVELSRNFGQHNALMAGFHFATGDIVITMDDDLQHNPSGIIKLIEKINEGYDVVYGAFHQKKHHWARNLGSKFNDKMANLLIKKPQNLYFSPFKAMRHYVVEHLIEYQGPNPYVDGLICRVTHNITWVYVEHRQRRDGNSNYTFKKLISLWLNMFTNFSILPLRVVTLFGFLMAGCAFLFGIYVLYEKIFLNIMPNGWASLMAGLSFLAGTQLFAIGFVGEYVGRLFMAINKTPQFIVKESTANFHNSCCGMEVKK